MRTIIVFILLLSFTGASAQKDKHALLIGIGGYNKEQTGWRTLASVRDVTLLRQSLINSQNFNPSRIFTVTDAQATKEGICKRLDSLYSVVKEGDIVLIHVSSHGIQLQDNHNRDEIDRLDEAIVPIDAVAPRGFMDPDYGVKEKRYLRDDTFSVFIQAIRRKLGPDGSIVLTMDMCHSGTAHKGDDGDEAVARGTSVPLVSTSFNQPPAAGDENLKGFRDLSPDKDGQDRLATYVVLSAGRAEESVYEVTNEKGEKMGPMTYALCKVFQSLPENITYRAFFAQVESIMLSKSIRQHPVLEGNGIDQLLWSNQYEAQKPYFKISTKKGNQVIKTNVVTLEGGLFAGLDVGAKLAVYMSGHKPATDSPFASGIVLSSSPFASEVKLDKNLNKKPADVWVYLTEPVYNVKNLVLGFGRSGQSQTGMQQNKYSDEVVANIKRELSELKLVQFAGVPELRLVKGPQMDSLIVAEEDFLFALVTANTIAQHIKRYIKYKFLKELLVRDTTLNVEVRLLPIKNGKPVFKYADSNIEKGLSVHVGDSAVIMVKNNSKQPVYINILDLQPDGKINPIFPNKGISPEELRIKPKDSVIFDEKINPAMIIRWWPPYGTEIFKVFISRDKLDVQDIATEGASKNVKAAFLKMFGEVDRIGTKGDGSRVIYSGEGTVMNIQFRILPKK